MQKPSNARGTRDFGPKEMAKRNFIFSIIKTHFQNFGFQAIETPAIENLSVLTGKYGEEGDQLLFKILNSGNFMDGITDADIKEGPKSLTFKISEKGLRYDLTVPFARFVSMNRNDLAFPFRRYQIQPVWRADRPQKGRYREFFQCDADIIGSNSLINECELIALFQSVFKSLNVKSNLYINSRKILSGIADKIGKIDQFTDFAVALDKLDKIGWEKVAEELISKGFNLSQTKSLEDLITFKGSNQECIDVLEGFFGDNIIGISGINEIKEVFQLVETNGFDNSNIIFDFKLARGLSYYTGLIYEGKSADVPFGSIVGGGRYDNLTSAFGLPNMSGVGISFGIERIIDVMEILNLFPEINSSGSKVLFTYFDSEGQLQSLKYLALLRSKNIPSEIYPDYSKIKKAFEFADKKQIPYVVVLGESELSDNKINIKNMKNGEQQLLSISELIQFLAND